LAGRNKCLGNGLRFGNGLQHTFSPFSPIKALVWETGVICKNAGMLGVIYYYALGNYGVNAGNDEADD
jgi:hypothetical protein